MFIFSNLATSLDGKIATASRSSFWLGTPADRKLMLQLRAKADALVYGASTLRTYGKYCSPGKFAQKGPLPWNAVLSHHLEGIDPGLPFFTHKNGRRVLFVASDISRKTLAPFEKTSEIRLLTAEQQHSPAPAIVQQLGALGVKRLLVEGGGGMMWHFAQHNLIQEYYLTLTPRILGGTEAPTVVDGEGFTPEQSLKLKLKSIKRLKDEVYLVYRSTHARRA